MTGFEGNASYTLWWPRDLFIDSVEDLYSRGAGSGMGRDWKDAVLLLLRQAFASKAPAEDFKQVLSEWPSDDGVNTCLQWLSELADAAKNQTLGAKPYFSQRGTDASDARESSLPAIVGQVRLLVKRLSDSDYFCGDLGFDCPYEPDSFISTPLRELDRRVGKSSLWVRRETQWSESDLYDFVEVFHDLATRPTRVWYCDGACNEWHPASHSREFGQALYRGLMNQLLDKTALDMRIAESGEDIGRLVQASPEGVGRLVEEMLEGQSPAKEQVSYAIATFRQREGTVEQRRSAVVSLAGVLEERKALLKEELLTNDAKDLFHIANRFHLRHQNEQQKKDYDPEFLDWIFYWYLATVKLSDQLSAKEASS